MEDPGGRPTRPELGTSNWHREIAAIVVALAHDLASVDSEQIEERIEAALATIGETLGLAAVGERTVDPGRGKLWFDESVVGLDEVSDCVVRVDELGRSTVRPH